MQIPSEFKSFYHWMIRRGRSEGTAELYIRNIISCKNDRRGVLARISQDGLAPKTRRTHKAALAAWSDFTEDDKLRRKLRDIKLPPPERIREKRALELDDWRAVIAAVDKLDQDDPIVAAMGLVCVRGFRIGDVLRLRKRTISDGLSSGVLMYISKGHRRIGWTVSEPMRRRLEIFMGYRRWGHVWDLAAPNSRKELRLRAARLNSQRAFAKVVESAGLEPSAVSLHIMRRTYAWHYLHQSGRDPVALQKHMSWASINTAMQYVDQSERATQDAVAESMLDGLLDD